MADPASNHSIDVGTVVAGTYQILRLLGKGGMGSVWEANHLRLEGKKVAIKVLHAEVASDDESVARFRREAQIASRLGHPNIVQVLDFNELPDGSHYLVLEYLEGENLADRLTRGFVPVDYTLAIVRQVGSALHAAHSENIIHRDLKPHNIFLCPTEAGGYVTELAKVLDFGISKMRDSQTVQTQANTVLGTPQYMAPEQAMGQHDAVDARTDIFALGAIVYEMLAGKPAFQGANIPEVMFKVVYEEAPGLDTLVPGLDPGLVRAVHRALAKKQDARFADVSEFVEALTGDPLSTLRGGLVAGVSKKPTPLAITPQNTPALTPRGITGLVGKKRAHSEEALAETAAPGTPAPGVQPSLDSTAMARTAALHDDAAAMTAAAATTDAKVANAGAPRARSRGLVMGLVGVVLAVAAAVAITIVIMKQPAQDSGPPGTGVAAGHDTDSGAAGPLPAVEPDAASSNNTAGAQQAASNETAGTGDAGAPDTQGTTPAGTDRNKSTSEKHAQRSPQQARPERPAPDDAEAGPVAERLEKARALFKEGNLDRAIREARSSLGVKKTSAAYIIITRAYCAQRDLGNARANFQNIQGRRMRRRVIRYCRQYDIDLSDLL